MAAVPLIAPTAFPAVLPNALAVGAIRGQPTNNITPAPFQQWNNIGANDTIFHVEDGDILTFTLADSIPMLTNNKCNIDRQAPSKARIGPFTRGQWRRQSDAGGNQQTSNAIGARIYNPVAPQRSYLRKGLQPRGAGINYSVNVCPGK